MTTDRTLVRAAAADDVRAALGIEPTEEALLDRLAGQLDADEMAVATAAVDRVPADRRRYALAALAAASLAMDLLDTGWWHEARPRSTTLVLPAVDHDRAPATLLRPPPARDDRPDFELLDAWAEDDVADHQWGPPAGFVDINTSATVDRSAVPENARPGDRFLMSWDPGCRVEAVVEEREGGRLGLTADGELLYSSAHDLSWNWATATENED